jgi:crotonobetainyl-CoA:carnitine CoA-transferase CaiB-like acyl-CoA transferase
VRTTAEALAELEKAKVPAGPLYSPQQALEDAHIRAAGLLADTDYPGLPRPAPLAPTPVDLSETPGPATLLLLGTTMAGLGLAARRKRNTEA